MKILVLGVSGMAGHIIATHFINKKYEVHTLSRKKVDIGINHNFDVQNLEKLKDLVIVNKYDVVINAVGLLNEFAEENKAQSIIINSYLPHFLVDITKNKNTKIVHMSTDCVFSGEQGNYIESDIPDGSTFYDKTKALGEINNEKDLTFRNSIIGPDMNSNGIGLFNWFMKQSGEIEGYKNAIWSGVTTITLAKAMEKAIVDDLSGLYHLVNNKSISKLELLNLFNKYFKGNELTIKENNKVSVNKSLINTRNDFNFIVPTYENMIKEMKDWIMENNGLYIYQIKAGKNID